MHKFFNKLDKSNYRRRFRLNKKELDYLKKKKTSVIRDEALNFLTERICPGKPKNDGKQTPMSNHPVFIAQHATATCCRKCIEKWHNIPRGKKLTKKETTYLLEIIMQWIDRDLTRSMKHPYIAPTWGWGAE